MSRYRGPRLRIIRRLGLLPSFTLKRSKKRKTPGEHGKYLQSDRKKKEGKQPPQYLLRLQEKQKLRFNYGITDSKLLRYIRQAQKAKGATGDILFQMLEMRLDNLVFRLGVAPTVNSARQLVNHGHILVNDKKVTIPSYHCKVKDSIRVADKKQTRNKVETFLDNPNKGLKLKRNIVPKHLTFNRKELVGTVNSNIRPDEARIQLNKRLIVEYYSRKI